MALPRLALSLCWIWGGPAGRVGARRTKRSVGALPAAALASVAARACASSCFFFFLFFFSFHAL